ncbi:MAG: Gfo/Idh/MocA family oxidoreductase [Clostridia bacterium]|nr:Gfo/Idh/MocA family oxidoreductase [Clostridia bacterium]
MKNIRFGILGCGMIANVHAQALSQAKGAVLYGVCDNDSSRAEKFSRDHGVKFYESYNDMLGDRDIDAICICTPSCFHAQNAIDAMMSGKHVVLEKPMALTVADAERVIEVSERSGKILTVISQLRFSSDIAKVKKLISENAFGKISLCSLYMKYYRSKEYYASGSWRGKKAFDGGGALMNQGIHGVDLLTYIVGNVVDVKGCVRTLSHDIEVEDSAVATLRFENGALGVIEASTCAYPGFNRRIEICGDKGYVIIRENRIEELMINGERVETESFVSESTSSDPSAVQSDMHKLQIENFVNAINGDEDILVDCHAGKKALEIIEAIYKTSESEC